MVTRRRFLALTGATLAGGAGAVLYAKEIEPEWHRVVRLLMPFAALPPELAGTTVVQISDLHVGTTDPAYLRGALQDAAALAADVVVMTGDFVSYESSRQITQLEYVLHDAPRGVVATFAVLGNHDYGPGWRHLSVADEVSAVLRSAGIEVLRNRSAVAAGIRFVGLGDFWSPEWAGARQTLGTIPRREPTIVLCHNPDAVDQPGWDGVHGWILSGHTHGGQCKPPLFRPPILPIRNPRYAAGRIELSPERTLYVNRGLGYGARVRFNVRPEITHLTITRAHLIEAHSVPATP